MLRGRTINIINAVVDTIKTRTWYFHEAKKTQKTNITEVHINSN